MTSFGDQEAELRNWLVDYLVTNIGCSPDQIDLNAPLNELGVGSRDAVVLSGELSELLRRPVSPVDFWQNPTINALAHALVNPDAEPSGGVPGTTACTSLNEPIAVIGLGCRLPGDIHGPDALWDFLAAGRSAVGTVPDDRWQAFDDGSPEASAALANTTRWGSFLSDIAAFRRRVLRVSRRGKPTASIHSSAYCSKSPWRRSSMPASRPKRSRRSLTGVFVGACLSEYGYLASRDLGRDRRLDGHRRCAEHHRQSALLLPRSAWAVTHGGHRVLVFAGRVHLACQSLRTGESELAIAAGVNLLLSPAVTRSFDAAEAMSPDRRLPCLRRRRRRIRPR